MKIKENDLTMTEMDLTGTTKHPIVEQMEKEWPEMTGEFRRLQREQYELFCRKQHDYGPGNISVGTQLQTNAEIKLALTGLWFRMNDKAPLCDGVKMKRIFKPNAKPGSKDGSWGFGKGGGG